MLKANIEELNGNYIDGVSRQKHLGHRLTLQIDDSVTVDIEDDSYSSRRIGRALQIAVRLECLDCKESLTNRMWHTDSRVYY